MTIRKKPLRSHGRRRYPGRRLIELMVPGCFRLHPTKGWRWNSMRRWR